jgi:GR25 family glycosyltransferase involved in LPS biosynthesis
MLVSCVYCPCCEAKIENHFRKLEGKSYLNKGPNVDFIYMINLDERPEKFKRSSDLLRPYGIIPYRVSGVNGWKLTLAEINDMGLKYTNKMKKGMKASRFLPENPFQASDERLGEVGQSYFCHNITRGAVGILVSHLSILQDAYDSGYETIWVFEDDIEIAQDPRLVFERIEQLDAKLGAGNWDMLFTDRDTRDENGNAIVCRAFGERPNFSPKDPQQFNKRIQIDPTFIETGARYGAYSVIIRRSGIKKMLDFIKTYDAFLPYDIEYCFPEGIRLINVSDDIVRHQTDAHSDNHKPRYKQK